MRRLNWILNNGEVNMRRTAFTLIELLIVLMIISVLATFVVVKVANRPGQARVIMAKANIQEISKAVALYKMDNSLIPSQQQGLRALVVKPDVAPVPKNYNSEAYLQKVPKDPWNNDYVYLVPGKNNQPFEIISYGSDGQPGGDGEAADISSADL